MGDGYSRLMARRNLRDDVNLAELSTWYNFANQLSTYGAPLGWKVSSSWGQSASYGAKGYGGEITKTWVEITPLRGQNGGNPVTYEFNGGGGGFMAPGWGVSGSAYNWPTRGEELYKGNLPLQSSNNALNPDELVGPAMLIDVNRESGRRLRRPPSRRARRRRKHHGPDVRCSRRAGRLLRLGTCRGRLQGHRLVEGLFWSRRIDRNHRRRDSGLRHCFKNRMTSESLAGGLGFEPRLAESESAVLPLDDPPPGSANRHRLTIVAKAGLLTYPRVHFQPAIGALPEPGRGTSPQV